jgi:hypothetical protein
MNKLRSDIQALLSNLRSKPDESLDLIVSADVAAACRFKDGDRIDGWSRPRRKVIVRIARSLPASTATAARRPPAP